MGFWRVVVIKLSKIEVLACTCGRELALLTLDLRYFALEPIDIVVPWAEHKSVIANSKLATQALKNLYGHVKFVGLSRVADVAGDHDKGPLDGRTERRRRLLYRAAEAYAERLPLARITDRKPVRVAEVQIGQVDEDDVVRGAGFRSCGRHRPWSSSGSRRFVFVSLAHGNLGRAT